MEMNRLNKEEVLQNYNNLSSQDFHIWLKNKLKKEDVLWGVSHGRGEIKPNITTGYIWVTTKEGNKTIEF